MEDQYYDPVTYQTDKYQVRVYHPILTDEERARRQKSLEQVTARFMREVLNMEKNKKRRSS